MLQQQQQRPFQPVYFFISLCCCTLLDRKMVKDGDGRRRRRLGAMWGENRVACFPRRVSFNCIKLILSAVAVVGLLRRGRLFDLVDCDDVRLASVEKKKKEGGLWFSRCCCNGNGDGCDDVSMDIDLLLAPFFRVDVVVVSLFQRVEEASSSKSTVV